MRRSHWLFCLLALFVQDVQAQKPAPTSTTPPFKVTAPPPWFFRPRWTDIWVRVNSDLEDKNYAGVLNTYSEKWLIEPSAKDELYVAYAMALKENSMPLSAQKLLQDVAARSLGTNQGQWAVQKLAELSKDNAIDEDALDRLAINMDAPLEPIEAASMIGYFRWRNLTRRGYSKWAESPLLDIRKDTPWNDELLYSQALSAIAKEDSDTALALFDQVAASPHARSLTKQFAGLQSSRILFERKEFEKAFDQYQKLTLPIRERGRSLLEMAWSQYYVRNFSQALGILHALKTNFFDSSRTPERYVLEMIILRDLCYFDQVRDLAAQFRTEFADVYKTIENREPLENNQRLVQIALLDFTLQKPANVIFELREEKRKFDLLKINTKSPVSMELNKYYASREEELKFKLNQDIRKKTASVANQLIDMREQIKFIEYSSNIQAVGDTSRMPGYETAHSSALKFEQLYWPVKAKEFWWDEMSYYRAMISSRCQKPEGGYR